MAQHPQCRDLAPCSAVSASGRAVGRAVIHKNDFMPRLARQRGGDLPGQGGDIVRLVLDRHDHRYRHVMNFRKFPVLGLAQHGRRPSGAPYTGRGEAKNRA